MDHVEKDGIEPVTDDDPSSKQTRHDQRMADDPSSKQSRHDQRMADHAERGFSVADFIAEVLMEGTATFLVLFWTCLAVLLMEMYQTLTFPLVCAVAGTTVAFVLSWLGPTHFNPALTVTLAVLRRFPWTKVPFYLVAQLGGSLLACLAVDGLLKPRPEHFYGTVPIGPAKLSFLLEFLGSATLMIVISVVSDGTIHHRARALTIGGAVGMMSLIIGPISGGSMNPARSLGPAIIRNSYKSIWIYVVGPISGMLFGALIHAFFRHASPLMRSLSSKLKELLGLVRK